MRDILDKVRAILSLPRVPSATLRPLLAFSLRLAPSYMIFHKKKIDTCYARLIFMIDVKAARSVRNIINQATQ